MSQTNSARNIILIAHNVRSTHNVGSLLRTAEGLGIQKVYLTGYTPYPQMTADDRLPHMAAKISRQIQKTALGAEQHIHWEHAPTIFPILDLLEHDGYEMCAVEQAENSVPLTDFKPGQKVALIIGREVEGIEPEVLEHVQTILEIPMFGQKESFNVAQAAAMALFHCRFFD